ncbi:MAG: J domain-containing protein [Bradymonadales bacterium]|jgi:hypothetical protein
MKHTRPRRIEDLDFSAFHGLLKPHEWVVLDFATGTRSFDELLNTLPYSRELTMEALARLHELQIVHWTPDEVGANCEPNSSEQVPLAPIRIQDENALRALLSTELFEELLNFSPNLIDPSLELQTDIQWLLEFYFLNAGKLSDEALLGLSPAASKEEVQRAYLRRTKLLHPDRYFRKNIGPFAEMMAKYYQEFTKAYKNLYT